MLDEENSRLKGLLIATTFAYILGWVIGIFLNETINTDTYLLLSIDHSWVIYLTWLLAFIGFCWIPLSIFLLAQGFILKRRYSDHSYTGDRTIGNLSVVVPITFVVIYIFSRVLY